MAVRVDKWMWAVRLTKTRTRANEACSSGKVRVNSEVAKPATKLNVGDEVEFRDRQRTVVVEVRSLIEKRVGAALAADCYEDRSPEQPGEGNREAQAVFAQRDRGTGRPTKRDRRRMTQMKTDPRDGG